MYHFDTAKHGQPVTPPDLRICPLRDAVYQKLVRNVLDARSPEPTTSAGSDGPPTATVTPTLQSGEVGILIDGGRKGNAARLLAPWKEGTSKERKSKKEDDEAEVDDDNEDDNSGDDRDSLPGFVPSLLQIAITEASLAARRKFVRGTASIRQLQNAHVVSHRKVCLPERPRINYPGTNSGDLIQGVDLPPLDKEWHLTVGQKKKLFGKKNLIAVGGKTAGADPNDEKERRVDSKLEPVSYQSLPEELLGELCHTFFVKLVIDLTPLDAKFAWYCLKNRIAYIGLTFTDDHTMLLEERLLELLKASCMQEGSGFYQPMDAKAMSSSCWLGSYAPA